MKMPDDPIVAEVRRVKEEHAARYGYDVRAMAQALKQEQDQGTRKVVSLPPKPATV
jgi:hypothetical protein